MNKQFKISYHLGKTLIHNEIDLDIHQFKEGKVRCEIQGTSRADIHFINNNDGHLKINYKVTIPGDYRINIKFNTFYVMGCPFHVKVSGSSVTSLHRHGGTGKIRFSSKNSKPITFESTADYVFIKKGDYMDFSMNSGDRNYMDRGRRSVIDTIDYSNNSLPLRYLAYNI